MAYESGLFLALECKQESSKDLPHTTVEKRLLTVCNYMGKRHAVKESGAQRYKKLLSCIMRSALSQ